MFSALIKMKRKHYLCHKAVPLGQPSTPYLRNEIQCYPFNAAVVSHHKQYQTKWRKHSYASILHDFPESGKESVYKGSEYLRASEQVIQPYVLPLLSLNFLSTKLC